MTRSPRSARSGMARSARGMRSLRQPWSAQFPSSSSGSASPCPSAPECSTSGPKGSSTPAQLPLRGSAAGRHSHRSDCHHGYAHCGGSRRCRLGGCAGTPEAAFRCARSDQHPVAQLRGRVAGEPDGARPAAGIASHLSPERPDRRFRAPATATRNATARGDTPWHSRRGTAVLSVRSNAVGLSFARRGRRATRRRDQRQDRRGSHDRRCPPPVGSVRRPRRRSGGERRLLRALPEPLTRDMDSPPSPLRSSLGSTRSVS